MSSKLIETSILVVFIMVGIVLGLYLSRTLFDIRIDNYEDGPPTHSSIGNVCQDESE